MICMALAPLKIRGSDGVVRELGEGETFVPKDPETLRALLDKGKIKIVENRIPISPERRRTLEDTAYAILSSERDKVLQIGRWHLTPEARDAERRINLLYGEVIEGRGKLIDFVEACKRWRKEGTR